MGPAATSTKKLSPIQASATLAGGTVAPQAETDIALELDYHETCNNCVESVQMNQEEIMNKVKGAMTDVFEVDDIELTAATSAEDIEEWDSLSHIRLMITLERTFKIKFRNEEIAQLKDIGELVQIIEAKLSANS
jgi:acyl carrier protein